MTIDDLCREIAEKTAREGLRWYISPVGRIRECVTQDCPLAVLFGQESYDLVAIQRGMRALEMANVLDAADYPGKCDSIRAKLLHATGLA